MAATEPEKSGNGYVIREGGEPIGEITYAPSDGGKVWIVDHTYVSPSHRGQNLASSLLQAVVDEARREGVKIEPACSYAAAQFKRRKDYADLLA
ncbi:N-acetyltransferase [Paenibacillus albicereus]|uniref:N-acetyltransferase n=1 Tax=Paenibacillus albicereus TaxID=2726185 RepID=A0A6H2GSS4_9BACL|nr:GNAT family N-acetyltransferase [Paenibacillus albicereus]QJC50481.1 N-acetyltransferase [Paenibacillus albicereus]